MHHLRALFFASFGSETYKQSVREVHAAIEAAGPKMSGETGVDGPILKTSLLTLVKVIVDMMR